jgi:hypothetical protein
MQIPALVQFLEALNRRPARQDTLEVEGAFVPHLGPLT